MTKAKIFFTVFTAILIANTVSAILTPNKASAGGWGLTESAERMAKALERIATRLERD